MKDNSSAYGSSVYDDHITTVLPYYREYHSQITDLVRIMGFTSPDWLDTGCGTGTLAMSVLQKFPSAKLTLCDPSAGMLEEARVKLAGRDISFLNCSSQQLEFESRFDVVSAVQCHHYLQKDEREAATSACYRALKEGGVYITFENIRMSDPASDAIALKRWGTFIGEHGNPPEEVARHIERRGVEVFPITIEEHLALLRKCGFKSADILWTSYLQAGFWAIR